MTSTIQQQQQPLFPSASLYVGDLLPDVTEGILYEQFNKVGPVASIRVCRDVTTRQSLGYAYVNFHNGQDAERALDTMNFTDIKNRPCRIMWSQRDPSLRKSGVGNIFVKNLPSALDNKGLFDVFSSFGNILSCKVVTDLQGMSKRYGYVHYETAEAARDAIARLTGSQLDNQDDFLLVTPFVPRGNRSNQREWTNVHIGQIPTSWDEIRLSNVTNIFGSIQNAAVMKDGNNNSRGFGFVNFHSHDSALRCVSELPKQEVEPGVVLSVNQALTRVQLRGQLRETFRPHGLNLYVKNLEEHITDPLLVDLFRSFGEIKSARVMREGPNFSGATKGFGFVCFKSPEQATAAISAMNNQIVAGGSKPIYVTFYQSKDERKNFLNNLHSNMRGNRNAGGGMYNQQPPMYNQQPAYPMYLNPNGMYRNPYPNNMYQGGGRMNTQPRSPGSYPRPQPMPFYQQMPYMQMPGHNQQQQQQVNRGGYKGARPQTNNGNSPRNQQAQAPLGNRPVANQIPRQNQQPVTTQPVPVPPPVNTPGVVGSGNYAQNLASMDPQEQKNSLGEALYPMIYEKKPHLAGKITGMLLEMDNAELVNLLESPQSLELKVDEALAVLRSHGIQ